MADKNTADVHASIAKLLEDTADFWAPLHEIARVDAPSLSPLEFYRRFVSKSVPVVLTNAMAKAADWQQVMQHWYDDAYLVEQAGDDTVTVDVTPFGFGDAVLDLDDGQKKNEVFVMPEEREMTFREFLTALNDRDGFDGVPYLSHQNDSLRDEFPMLYQDVPAYLELAKVAFGNEPEAVNIWIGDERAVSTMHKDHYENMYCVVRGQKHFTLLPPADIACLYESEFPSMRYRHQSSKEKEDDDEGHTDEDDAPALSADEIAANDAEAARLTTLFHEKYPQHTSWRIVPSSHTGDTPWIPVDPLHIDTTKFPLAQHLKPIECVVNEGEILYLPAMWYHRATQLCQTISVNYWHDMEFDCRYVYYNFVHDIAAKFTKEAEATS
ncbi:putative phospholipase, partial [Globisporangium splendens]